MAVSKAQQRATAKYEARVYDKTLIRMPKGRLDEIKAYAEAQGESVNGFINRAVNEAMAQETAEGPQKAGNGAGGILTPETAKTARAAAQDAGETVQQFLERAVTTQAQRDKVARSLTKKTPITDT